MEKGIMPARRIIPSRLVLGPRPELRTIGSRSTVRQSRCEIGAHQCLSHPGAP
jgi:hypothetical protein